MWESKAQTRRFSHLLILTLLFFLFVQTVRSQTNPIQTCTLSPYAVNDHAFWLNAIPGDPGQDYVFTSAGGFLHLFADSSIQITGQVQNQLDSTRRWEVDFWLINPRNYSDWTALGRSFKNGGGADTADVQNWTFYELDENRSIFRGVNGSPFDGDSLTFLHKPANLNFGFQWGVGANDKNGNVGISGWFNFEGSYQGRGDLNANVACDTMPPPPPACEVVIDSFYAVCKSDSSFETVLSFQGVGSNFEIQDNLGNTLLAGLSAGTYTVGDYFNSTDIMLTVFDPNFPACTEATWPVTLDCTPVPTCDLLVDTVYTQCANDSMFSIVVQVSGTSQSYIISDNQGTTPLDSLPAGTYTYGLYPEDSIVSLVVTDWAVFNCFEVLDSLTSTCADSTGGGVLASPPLFDVAIAPIFPNPVQTSTQIKIDSKEKEILPFSVRIVDAMGRTRQVSTYMIHEGPQVLDLTLEKSDPGLYFMSFGIKEHVVSAQRMLIVD